MAVSAQRFLGTLEGLLPPRLFPRRTQFASSFFHDLCVGSRLNHRLYLAAMGYSRITRRRRWIFEVAVAICSVAGSVAHAVEEPHAAAVDFSRDVTPAEFAAYKSEGLALGFTHIESGPLVRSSYHAAEAL